MVAPVHGEKVLAEAVAAYEAALGDRLLAAYALGSLAHGGFSAHVSDVDLGLIVADPPEPRDAERIQHIADAQRRGGSPLHERLSVFWGTPSTLAREREGGRFPPLDRLDLLDNGRLLAGVDARAGVLRPTTEELVVAGAEFALQFLAGTGDAQSGALGSLRPAGQEAIEELRAPQLLAGKGVRKVTKTVLFPVRFLYTAQTGATGANGAAVAHYVRRRDPAAPRLVEAALAWRDDPPSDLQAVTALLRRELVPLYLEYIDDHVARLEALGRDDLASAFVDWRRRLLA